MPLLFYYRLIQKIKVAVAIFIFSSALFHSTSSCAQTYDLVEVRRLSFGNFMIKDFDNPQTISVPPVDTPIDSNGPGIFSLTPAQCGIYELSGPPPLPALSVSITGGSLAKSGTIKSLVIDIQPSDISDLTDDDGDGVVTFYVGGTLQTDGAGFYPDGNYEGIMDAVMNVDVNF